MKPEKQVSFIERVNKSILGLEGLQIVVYCDRKRKAILNEEDKEKCTFLEIANKLLTQINGSYIKKKYNIEDGLEFGNKLHQERVQYLKGMKI